MKKKSVVTWKNLPMRPPALFTIVILLCLKVYQLPGWVYGVLWTLTGLLWVAWIIALFTEEQKTIWD